MSDYRRFISYLYEYKNEKKTYNRGFLKAEAKGGIFKLEIHIKDSGLAASVPVQIFGFTRNEDKLSGIFLGSTQTSSGSIGCCLKTADQDLNGSGVPMKDLNGILLLCGGTLCYASAWDDLPVNPQHFKAPESLSDAESESDAAPAEQPPETNDGSSGDTLPQSADETNPSAEDSAEEPSLEAEEVKELAEEEKSPAELMDFIPDPPLSRWERVMDLYESINPFTDGSVTECVRLDLKDLPALRKERWLIGNNPLILHAYSEHHHLILGKMDDHDRSVYIFGVPGTYTPKERFMADMYGFPYFKAANSGSRNVPRFGYWYRIID
ncbi:hypothetical protein [Ruminococcus gauvreauii]|uniref:hypothetical protein n=1 Tax=Ruminococcus gauvreauii TaxID=438033 RepID=UPI003983F6D0